MCNWLERTGDAAPVFLRPLVATKFATYSTKTRGMKQDTYNPVRLQSKCTK